MRPSPMITVTRGSLGSTAAQVLEQVRAGGVVHRDEIAVRTALSVATVGRVVGQLAEVGILRERPDRTRLGGVGRPGVPVEVNPDRFVTIGVHLGRRIATVALGDLTGRVLDSQTHERRSGESPDLLELSRSAARLLGRAPGRTPLSAGLVAPFRELGLDHESLGAALHDLTGLDVATADHIAAVAASEFLHRRHGTPGVTLYVYARDTVGFAVAVDKGVQTEVSRVGSLTHFPTGSSERCSCGRTGCLEAAAGDASVVAAAAATGLVSAPTIDAVYAAVAEPGIRALLRARARALGEVAAAVRDMIAPDRVVLVGQAFTGCAAVLEDITRAFHEATALGEVPLSFTRFGSGIQAIAACTIALGPVYDDPLAAATHATVPSPVTS
ncbi:ROK family protein [Nocardioides seonyuensis]|uniref:ROK family protein n=1 Tax=Nocardioides seonyuensis TaxID=2518371 RepID=A0A4P7IEU6_9ACTN|nr:ROK family protein [Nocardioides seonyuensis]QBX55270.1 ROK family protein [Nocardioides seonyuensis]